MPLPLAIFRYRGHGGVSRALGNKVVAFFFPFLLPGSFLYLFSSGRMQVAGGFALAVAAHVKAKPKFCFSALLWTERKDREARLLVPSANAEMELP